MIENYKSGVVLRLVTIEVAPSQDTQVKFDLNDWYDPIKPGKYTAQVERVGSLQVEPRGYVAPKGLVSAPVTFQVLP